MTEVDIYKIGPSINHTSDGGSPDVGISVGLGNGHALYAGEIPGEAGSWQLAIYSEKETRVIADISDDEDGPFGGAVDLIERIAGAIISNPSSRP